uniref:Uncharacterized protein n=1 Tax=Rhabditophanes sp. KR3021 TaxID=114890 RepID=A0AC35UI31_9BILA
LEDKEALNGRENKYLQKHRNNQTSAVQTIVRELDSANRANARASRTQKEIEIDNEKARLAMAEHYKNIESSELETQEEIEANHVVDNRHKKSKKSMTTLRNLRNCSFIVSCEHCFAVHFEKEVNKFCCNNGNTPVLSFDQIPKELVELQNGTHALSKIYKGKNNTKQHMALALASTQMNRT